MEIKTNDYHVIYDESKATVRCTGSFRLNGVDEYTPIVDLLKDAADAQPEALTLDLRQLEFLNSSGINVLSKFVISMRQRPNSKLTVIGSKRVPWQGKSLLNLQRLMPTLTLNMED